VFAIAVEAPRSALALDMEVALERPKPQAVLDQVIDFDHKSWSHVSDRKVVVAGKIKRPGTSVLVYLTPVKMQGPSHFQFGVTLNTPEVEVEVSVVLPDGEVVEESMLVKVTSGWLKK